MSEKPEANLRGKVVSQTIAVKWVSAITEEPETVVVTIEAPLGAFWGTKDTPFRLAVESGTKAACDEYVARMSRPLGPVITHVTTLGFFKIKIEAAGKQQRHYAMKALRSSLAYRLGLRKKRLEDIPKLPTFEVLLIRVSSGQPDAN